MRRRDFIKGIAGSTVVWPLAGARAAGRAHAAHRHPPARNRGDALFQACVGAFQQELALLGWTIGRNVRIDIRWATANAAEIRRHAAELAALTPDVILAAWRLDLGPLLQATRTVPIVFPVASDPVGAGFVDSLARPGGNATGFMSFEYSMGGKWLELLKQIAPSVMRVAVLRDAASPPGTSSSAPSRRWRRRSG